MPLTEVTVVKNGDEVVEEKERKLYTLAELKKLDDEGSEEIEPRAYENALDKLREWGYEWFGEEINEMLDSDGGPRALFEAVGITVPKKTKKINPKGRDGKFLKDEKGNFIEKWVTYDDTIWEEWDSDRRVFKLNTRAEVDAQKFLQALQWYLAGKDIRTLPELQWGMPMKRYPDGSEAVIESRRLIANPRQQRKLDLRSKDARMIREQGLVIQGSEFDFDYHYDGLNGDEHVLSQQTRDDANELLSDLCHETVAMIEEEADYRTSEEYLLEEAEANDRRFDKSGRPA